MATARIVEEHRRPPGRAAKVAFKRADTLPNSDYSIPESTPDLKARNRPQADQTHIPQFGERNDRPKRAIPEDFWSSCQGRRPGRRGDRKTVRPYSARPKL